jgi:circadian clock protein KaiB
MSQGMPFKFQLFVAGGTENSVQAVVNLNAICRTHLLDQYEIEVVDVLKEPKRALTNGILMTPTLVKLAPLPIRRIVGTLSQKRIVLLALGMESVEL